VVKRVSLKGKGAELFFGGAADQAIPPDEPGQAAETVAALPEAPGAVDNGAGPEGASSPAVRSPRSASPSPRDSKRASTLASTRASSIANEADAEVVESVRRVVKAPGKEVSFVRLTPAEKEELAAVVFAFKRQGVKTTETELNRIAINVLLADHRANGDGSLLARVLAALRA
jgi:hypothetical protein